MKKQILLALISFLAISLSGKAQCLITDVIAEAHACDADNMVLIDIDFDVSDPGPSNTFSVHGNGHNYGTFEYGEPFYTIGPVEGNCNTVYEFVVTDTDHNNCSDFYVISDPICCETTPDCSISNLSVDPIECTSDSTYAITLNFEYTGTNNNFFDVWSGNHFLGFYEFSDLPVTILNFPEDGSPIDHILVCENDNPNCCEDLTFNALICESAGDCSITDVIAEAHDCNGDGYFLVDIEFNYANIGSSNQFEILGNGNHYGTFEYGADFYTIGPLDGNCQTLYEFVVRDLDDNTCLASTFFSEPVCCNGNPDCHISEVVVNTLECTGDETYAISLDFEYTGTTHDYFNVWASNNVLLGTYLFSDLPVTITDYPEDGSATDHLLICESDNPHCCREATFEGLICGETGDCSITNLHAEVHECTPNGIFYVDLSFNYSHTGPSNTFSIHGNGTNYGTFEYGQEYYTVGPLEGDCETIYEFIVHDTDANDCASDYIEFEEPVCCGNEPECNISEIVVTPLECTGDETFAITINFDYTGTTNDYFDVWAANNLHLGTYLFSDLPVTISNYPEDGSETDHLLICENDNPHCCREATFEGLICGETGDCSITNLQAEAHECTPNGVFYVDLWFNYSNVGSSNTFSIHGNGTNYGTFEYGLEYYTVGPLNGDCETIYEFIIYDTDIENCTSNYTHLSQPICCNAGECLIYNMVVDTLECTGENQYAINLNFEYQGTSDIGFDVFANGDFIGFYDYNDLPITISEFPSDGGFSDVITVCDNDSESCCMTMEFPAVECTPEPCYFDDVSISASVCDGPSFYFNIDFVPGPGNSSTFYVIVNNEVSSFLSYSDLPVSVGPFTGDDVTVYEVQLVDGEYEACHASFNYGTVDCTGNFQGLTNISLLVYQNGDNIIVKNSKHPIPENARYSVYDISGRMINYGKLNKGIGSQSIEVAVEGMHLLLIKFNLGSHVVTKKLVIAR